MLGPFFVAVFLIRVGRKVSSTHLKSAGGTAQPPATTQRPGPDTTQRRATVRTTVDPTATVCSVHSVFQRGVDWLYFVDLEVTPKQKNTKICVIILRLRLLQALIDRFHGSLLSLCFTSYMRPS